MIVACFNFYLLWSYLIACFQYSRCCAFSYKNCTTACLGVLAGFELCCTSVWKGVILSVQYSAFVCMWCSPWKASCFYMSIGTPRECRSRDTLRGVPNVVHVVKNIIQYKRFDKRGVEVLLIMYCDNVRFMHQIQYFSDDIYIFFQSTIFWQFQ
jgi:hypothetical protein